MENKKIPNPWGKKGCPEHQGKIKETAEDIKDRNNIADFETYIVTPEGKKRGRFVDLTEIDEASGKPVAYYQIGKVNKNGNPPKREEEAMDDIDEKTGLRPIFKPYNLIILALFFLTGALIFEVL